MDDEADYEADYDGLECDRCGRQQNDDTPKDQRQTYVSLSAYEIICNDCYRKALQSDAPYTASNQYNADPRS